MRCNTLESITPFWVIWCNTGVILLGVLHQGKRIDIQLFNTLKPTKV